MFGYLSQLIKHPFIRGLDRGKTMFDTGGDIINASRSANQDDWVSASEDFIKAGAPFIPGFGTAIDAGIHIGEWGAKNLPEAIRKPPGSGRGEGRTYIDAMSPEVDFKNRLAGDVFKQEDIRNILEDAIKDQY